MEEFSTGGYPLGADNDSRAPWKEKDEELHELPVTITVTYTKSTTIKIPEGYSESEINNAAIHQVLLPLDLMNQNVSILNKYIEKEKDDKTLRALKKLRDTYSGWYTEEFEVVEE